MTKDFNKRGEKEKGCQINGTLFEDNS